MQQKESSRKSDAELTQGYHNSWDLRLCMCFVSASVSARLFGAGTRKALRAAGAGGTKTFAFRWLEVDSPEPSPFLFRRDYFTLSVEAYAIYRQP